MLKCYVDPNIPVIKREYLVNLKNKAVRGTS